MSQEFPTASFDITKFDISLSLLRLSLPFLPPPLSPFILLLPLPRQCSSRSWSSMTSLSSLCISRQLFWGLGLGVGIRQVSLGSLNSF